MNKNDLKQVLKEQQLEALALKKSSKRRDAEKVLIELVQTSRLIKVITGIRRAGKSTLCLGVIPESTPFSYVNFDDERLTALQTQDLNSVYEALLEIEPKSQIFIFDEIQNIPSWELFVNRLQRKKLNIMITGSNGKLLSKELATHLTGRQLSLEIMPLSFLEFLEFRKMHVESSSTEGRSRLKNLLQEYFDLGGFPDVVLGDPAGIYLRELFDKIITRDIAQRYQIRSPRKLKEIALYLVQNSGCLTSLEKFLSIFDITSKTTLRSYLDYLVDAYLLYEVQSYSKKLSERSTRPKKYYVCDLGMWIALNTKPTPDLGLKLETLVFLQLKRKHFDIYYLRQPEFDIDFCILTNGKVTELIQVSYTIEKLDTRKRELKSLIAAARFFHLKQGRIITWDEAEDLEENGISVQITPVWKFLME